MESILAGVKSVKKMLTRLNLSEEEIRMPYFTQDDFMLCALAPLRENDHAKTQRR